MGDDKFGVPGLTSPVTSTLPVNDKQTEANVASLGQSITNAVERISPPTRARSPLAPGSEHLGYRVSMIDWFGGFIGWSFVRDYRNLFICFARRRRRLRRVNGHRAMIATTR